MSERVDDHGSPKLELRLNLSPSIHLSPSHQASSPMRANSSTPDSASRTSIDSSCLSSEPDQEEITSSTKKNKVDIGCSSTSKQPEANNNDAGMVLVGCPRCLMYVILSEVNLKCPICKSSVLLSIN